MHTCMQNSNYLNKRCGVHPRSICCGMSRVLLPRLPVPTWDFNWRPRRAAPLQREMVDLQEAPSPSPSPGDRDSAPCCRYWDRPRGFYTRSPFTELPQLGASFCSDSQLRQLSAALGQSSAADKHAFCRAIDCAGRGSCAHRPSQGASCVFTSVGISGKIIPVIFSSNNNRYR